MSVTSAYLNVKYPWWMTKIDVPTRIICTDPVPARYSYLLMMRQSRTILSAQIYVIIWQLKRFFVVCHYLIISASILSTYTTSTVCFQAVCSQILGINVSIYLLTISKTNLWIKNLKQIRHSSPSWPQEGLRQQTCRHF